MKLLWIDLETTGLHLNEYSDILEIAWILTDESLNELDVGDRILCFPNDPHFINIMNEFVQKMHKDSGLLEKCFESKITRDNVQLELCQIIKEKSGGEDVLMAGSTVGFDKSWIRYLMPNLDKILHHRVVDVSTIKNCMKLWRPEHVIEHKRTHRAMDDIRQSIEELKYYRDNVFKASIV